MASKKESSNKFPGYHISNEARTILTTAARLSAKHPKQAVKVMMVGQSGYGKTTLPWLLAQATEKKFYRMNCGSVRDPEEWFGYREARAGNTVFIRSELMKLLEAGDCVVVLDEFNRLEPWLHNTLFPLLDHDGKTTVHDEVFTLGEGVIIVSTINTGYKYTGVFELDEALFNRFHFILEVGALKPEEEVKVLMERHPSGLNLGTAEKIVKVANTLRQNDIVCSTRSTLDIAMMCTVGMDLRSAFETVVIKRIPVDSAGNSLRKKAIDLINPTLGVYEPKPQIDDIFGLVEGSKPVGVAEEKKQSSPDAVALLSLRSKSKAEFLEVNLLQQLRKLEMVEPTPTLSLVEAKYVLNRIAKGEEVTLALAKLPADFTRMVESFQASGCEAKLTAKG